MTRKQYGTLKLYILSARRGMAELESNAPCPPATPDHYRLLYKWLTELEHDLLMLEPNLDYLAGTPPLDPAED